jgi:Rap1a immunity proteins
MKRRWLIAAGVLAGTGLSADIGRAEELRVSTFPGTKLLEACEAQDATQHAYCRGYIGAIVDLVVAGGRRSPIIACIPTTTTHAQVVDLAVEYLRDHPRETRSYAAVVLVLEAIRKGFRCH